MFTLDVHHKLILDVQPYGVTIRLPLIGEAFIRWHRDVVGRRLTWSPWRELRAG